MGVPGGQFDVGHGLIFDRPGLQGQVKAAANALIGPDVAEGFAGGERDAVKNLDPVHIGPRGPGAEKYACACH